jgi:pimeloyl-ACP methyl ester carboxylesterase
MALPDPTVPVTRLPSCSAGHDGIWPNRESLPKPHTLPARMSPRGLRACGVVAAAHGNDQERVLMQASCNQDAPKVPPASIRQYGMKRAADDIAELARQLGAPKIVLGGHDWYVSTPHLRRKREKGEKRANRS